MFDSIAELEKEIQTFRENMLASSKLVEGISTLIETTKEQKTEFSSNSSKLLHQIQSYAAQFQEEYQKALATLVESLDAERKAQEESLKAFSKNLGDHLSDVFENQEKQAALRVKEFNAQNEEMLLKLQTIQGDFLSKLTETEKTLDKYQTETKEHYSSFLR